MEEALKDLERDFYQEQERREETNHEWRISNQGRTH